MEEKQPSAESSSVSDGGSESSELVVELNVKTLDSRIYKFNVDKNMPVSVFKEKIANETGLPIVQQRLIFRGKVLKDDQLLSEYHVDNGHTLHLVERQPSDSQSSGSSTGETSTNNGGQDAGVTGSRGRVGHISHSVVLGTLNLGDQVEGVVPDLSRVLGAVLNSIGIGAQAMPGGVPTVQANAPGQSHPNATERSQNGSGVHSQASGQTQQGQGLSDQSLPHVLRIPIGAAIPVPTLHTPIPDSLRTLSDFISRMEHVLSQNGYGSNQPSSGDSSTVELPSIAHGLSTHESLSIVMRQAERLLSNHATAALSHIAGRLEREGSSMDPTIRGQIQTESIQVGMAMQHLGSLLLELGRTILSLRMGQTPAESFVSSGHAVYISSFGPNPIMVQPFPLQATTMFGASPPNPSNQGSFGSVGIGTVPRNVNIHIHTAVAPGAAVMEGSQGDGNSGPADSGQTQESVLAGMNPRPRNYDNGQNGNPVLSGQSANITAQSAAGGFPKGKADSKFEQLSMQDGGGSSNTKDIPSGSSENTMSVPLGLGMGGLKPKRRVKPERSQDRRSSSESGGSDDSNVEEQMRVHAHQVLETLKSFTDRSPETPSARQMSMQRTERGGVGGGQSSNAQFDIASAMSQVLNNPAFSGLLAGVSEQAGVGSPEMLRDMMMQITQNPGMRNTITQMAQQFEGQDLGNMFGSFGRAGPGGAGGGGMDLSSMFQQMMPLVSQMLGGGSTVPGMPSYEAQRRLGGDDVLFHNIQVDLQDVVERIVNQDAPREIFCSMVEAAAQLDDTCSDQLIEELCDDEGLAKEFMELLRQDISRRLEGPNKNS
ncbi:ubiquitin-like domain-containing protein CIP73 [Impatiens glandulifera]|uniref:ubiquitin-like domain-containing protein CIP73 n=1 Tax=Impatiens glandulifera TaxID=253017 RepID=UPI001FB0C62E|nr:ubiquitin-like domain-containing protein CIP73 [Impatiens glandulifera]